MWRQRRGLTDRRFHRETGFDGAVATCSAASASASSSIAKASSFAARSRLLIPEESRRHRTASSLSSSTVFIAPLRSEAYIARSGRRVQVEDGDRVLVRRIPRCRRRARDRPSGKRSVLRRREERHDRPRRPPLRVRQDLDRDRDCRRPSGCLIRRPTTESEASRSLGRLGPSGPHVRHGTRGLRRPVPDRGDGIACPRWRRPISESDCVFRRLG